MSIYSRLKMKIGDCVTIVASYTLSTPSRVNLKNLPNVVILNIINRLYIETSRRLLKIIISKYNEPFKILDITDANDKRSDYIINKCYLFKQIVKDHMYTYLLLGLFWTNMVMTISNARSILLIYDKCILITCHGVYDHLRYCQIDKI